MNTPESAAELVSAYRKHHSIPAGNWWWASSGTCCSVCHKTLQRGEIIYRDNIYTEVKYNCCVGCTLSSTTLPTIADAKMKEEAIKKCNCEWEIVYTQGCQCGGK